MKAHLAALFLAPLVAMHAAVDGNTWLVQYDGKSLPASPWTAVVKPNAEVEADTLNLRNDSKDNFGAFEAE